MYKVEVRWGKGEEKVVYVCSGKVERDGSDGEGAGEEVEVGERDYGRFVKDNIHGYFDQYYPNQPTNSSRTPSSNKNPHLSSKKHPISNS